MWIAAIALCIIIIAILLGLAVWRLALRSKASKEAKDAKSPAPETTFQGLVNGLVLLIGLLMAALGIVWGARKQNADKKAKEKRAEQKAQEAAASGRR